MTDHLSEVQFPWIDYLQLYMEGCTTLFCYVARKANAVTVTNQHRANTNDSRESPWFIEDMGSITM